jgi:hypothetical protein
MLATCSYRLWRPDYGVPIRTSVGPPRSFSAPLAEWPTVYPWGIYNLDLDEETFRRKYRHQLHRRTPKILAELADLREGYDQPIVLLCFEDLSKPGAWCHRRLLAEWISQKLGEKIPELGLKGANHVST